LKIDKLLAGTLALVLIAGLGTPAFAEPQITQSNSGSLSSNEIANMQTAHNIVFDNGGLPISNAGLTITDVQAGAEDFIIDTDTFVTDFHFVSIREPSGLEYRIFSDGGGLPSTTVLASGSAQNIVTSQIGTSDFWEVWFDLEDPEDPFLAEAGVLYWFSLHSTINNDGAFVQTTTGGFGSFTAHEFPLFSDSWTLRTSHAWFLLSGQPVVPDLCEGVVCADDGNLCTDDLGCDADTGSCIFEDVVCPDDGNACTIDSCNPSSGCQVAPNPVCEVQVGGEIIPIESTSLILAGAQSFSWIIPLVLSVLGIGLFVVSRKSENS
jgi:hypothetical protein